jgi:hypothetical protein
VNLDGSKAGERIDNSVLFRRIERNISALLSKLSCGYDEGFSWEWSVAKAHRF